MKRTEQWSRFDVADGLATEADMVADDVERARAKLRGQPRYTLEELLAQCDPNATASEVDWGYDAGSEHLKD